MFTRTVSEHESLGTVNLCSWFGKLARKCPSFSEKFRVVYLGGKKKTLYKLHMELMELNFFSSDHTIENKNKVDLNVYLTQYIKNIILKCYKYFKIPR